MKAQDFIGISRAAVKMFLKRHKAELRKSGIKAFGLSESEKAALYLEKVFNISTRYGIKYHPGFEFVQVTDGDLPVRVEKHAGALIVASGTYKTCRETLRDYIHKFRTGDRFFEISEVNEVTDELKNRQWQACPAVLWQLPNVKTLERYARDFENVLKEIQISFGFVPKIYLYQDEAGMWLKAICYDEKRKDDWKLTIGVIRQMLDIPKAEEVFTKAFLWLYSVRTETLERLPEEVVAVRKVYNLGNTMEGLVVCAVCGKAMPCIGFEASTLQYCTECQKVGHHVSPEAPKAPKTVCYPGDPERSFC